MLCLEAKTKRIYIIGKGGFALRSSTFFHTSKSNVYFDSCGFDQLQNTLLDA